MWEPKNYKFHAHILHDCLEKGEYTLVFQLIVVVVFYA